MTIGPLELLVIGFEGNNFKGEIAPAIEDAVNSGAIRLIDLIFALKDTNGEVTILEVEEANEQYAREIRGMANDLRDILTEDEAMTMAALLPPNTAALVALIEHTWSKGIAGAVERAGGRLLASQRISPRLVEEVSGQLEEMMATAPARQR